MEEKAICKGKYFHYASKEEAIEACQKDDSCDGIEGVSPSSTSNVCDDENTVFHLCKRLDVDEGTSQSNCFLKKRYGRIIIYNNRFNKQAL